MSRQQSDRSPTSRRRRDQPGDRRERIIDVAVRLAEQGGFENVRQRDVARLAGVALGTLYKSFGSKEEILAAALQRETDALERRLADQPMEGESMVERLESLFRMLTEALLRKPAYARAVLRAMTAGAEVAANVVAHQSQVTRMILAAARPAAVDPAQPDERDLTVALYLQQIWFAALVGWSAGLLDEQQVVAQVKTGARLLVAGADATAP